MRTRGGVARAVRSRALPALLPTAVVHALLACNAGAELAALRNIADFNPATLPLTRHLLAMCVSRRLPWGHGCADMVGTAETVQRKPVPHGADETLSTLQRPCRGGRTGGACGSCQSPPTVRPSAAAGAARSSRLGQGVISPRTSEYSFLNFFLSTCILCHKLFNI